MSAHVRCGQPTILTVASAARRAALGHPEPFKLQYVEIGNEVRYLFFRNVTYNTDIYMTRTSLALLLARKSFDIIA